jgi:phospholipid/cholesterol/gamma-HCH transport system substrate-binding protein
MPYVIDVTGRGESTASLARRGLVAVGVLVLVLVLVLLQYRGVFRSSFPVKALVTDVGDGIGVGADVKLRGVLVGQVAAVRLSTGPGQQTLHEVDLELDPAKAAGIPSGVTARVVPTNVFGAPSLELLDPGVPTSRMLASGDVIHTDTSQPTLQFQSVINQSYRILTAVRPADLNVALTSLAQALHGRGGEIGSLIGNGDQYLTALNAQTPTFNALLRQLGPSVQSLGDNAPELLDTLDNAVAAGQNFVHKRDQLVDVLTQAPGVLDDTNTLLHQVDDPVLRLLSDLRPVGSLLAGQYQNIPASLSALNVAIPLLQSGLAGGLHLSVGLTPFTRYTYADCPRYHELKGPNCGKPVPADTAPPPGFPFFEQKPGQPLPVPPALLAPVAPPHGRAGHSQDNRDRDEPKSWLGRLFDPFSGSADGEVGGR